MPVSRTIYEKRRHNGIACVNRYDAVWYVRVFVANSFFSGRKHHSGNLTSSITICNIIYSLAYTSHSILSVSQIHTALYHNKPAVQYLPFTGHTQFKQHMGTNRAYSYVLLRI